MTAAWVVALILILAGSRWSRLVVAAGIAMQALASTQLATRYGGEPASVGLRFFLPMSVPLLPLVVLRVEEPRVVLALAALGRWREARARFGGVGVLAVAVAVISLNRGVLDLIGVGFDPGAMLWVIRDRGVPWTGTMLPVVLFGAAALSVWATPRPLRPAPTSC